MTDSQSILTTLERQTEERLAAQQREIGLLRAGTIRVLETGDGGERDVSAGWLARLEEWAAADAALLTRLRKP